MKLLHIVASPRGAKSRTLDVSNAFLEAMKAKDPNITIDVLDLFEVELPDVHLSAVDAKFTLMSGGTLDEKAKATWEVIAKYSKGFLEHDAYLISCPMWNFTIPYKLKHYIDVIMQAGILFSFSESGVKGHAEDKKMFCVTSRGNDYSEGSHMNPFDFQEPYLRAIFNLIGIHDISFVHAQPLDFAPGITEQAMKKAKEEAVKMAEDSFMK